MKVVSGYVFLRTYYMSRKINKNKMYNNLLVPSREMLFNIKQEAHGPHRSPEQKSLAIKILSKNHYTSI